jgi:uncharacterized protein (TIGR02391 family)
MSSLSLPNKAFLENIFGMQGGYVLDFSNTTFSNFFAEFDIDIYDDEYGNLGGSKANRMRAFWKNGSDANVSLVLNSLADYIEEEKASTDVWGEEAFSNITSLHIVRLREIAINLSNASDSNSLVAPAATSSVSVTTEATVTDNKIQIEIHEDVYSHIKRYLDTGDYFHAVDESYKVVREKLRDITGEEKATEVFNMNAENKRHYQKLFGKTEGATDAEKNFLRGVGYLNLTIQFLRNEKSHSLAAPIDPNLAVHYISLASLAYDLITRHVSEETVEDIEAAIIAQKQSYKSASAFYTEFEGGKWLQALVLPVNLNTSLRNTLKKKWLEEADLTRSYNHSNTVLMQLELVADALTKDEIDSLLDLPTKDKYGHDQSAGMPLFMKFIQQRYPDKTSKRVSDWIAKQEQ